MRRRAFLAGLAASAPLRAAGSDRNAQALDGARFKIGDQEFLLADVLAPPLYTLSDNAPAYFEASRRALQTLLASDLEIEDLMAPTRWSVRRVKARSPSAGETVQEMLARAGAVRVSPESGDHVLIAKLLQLENEARNAKRGLWALADYRVFQSDDARGAVGDYNLIEGKALRAEKHGPRFYLNFGEDFREDFTAGAASALHRRWLKDGLDLATLHGARLRIRGYVEWINGPSIDLKHPMQIERLA